MYAFGRSRSQNGNSSLIEMLFRRRSDLIFGAAIGLAVIAAVWLRWSGLDSQSLWADEGYTVWIRAYVHQS